MTAEGLAAPLLLQWWPVLATAGGAVAGYAAIRADLRNMREQITRLQARLDDESKARQQCQIACVAYGRRATDRSGDV